MRRKFSTMKKQTLKEEGRWKKKNDPTSPAVVWYRSGGSKKGNWMRKCKKYMKQNGCVVLRGVFSKIEIALLDADLRGGGYFSEPRPRTAGNLNEKYIDRGQLSDDNPKNLLQKRLMGVVRRISAYVNKIDQEEIDIDLAALKKEARSPMNQIWHADDIYQCNFKALCYTSSCCAPPKIFEYRKLGGKPVPRSLTKRDIAEENFRGLIAERFGPVFDAKTTSEAAALYERRDDDKGTGTYLDVREILEEGDVFLFYGDLPHFGWNNLHADEDKYFLFVNSSLTGQVDQSFQFHIGEYCNYTGGWTTTAFWGKNKRDLIKRHLAVTGVCDARSAWDKETCRLGLSIFFHNGHPRPEIPVPKSSPRSARGLHPHFEMTYKTENEYKAWLEDLTRDVRKAVTSQGGRIKSKRVGGGEDDGAKEGKGSNKRQAVVEKPRKRAGRNVGGGTVKNRRLLGSGNK